jgi:integrase
MASGHVTKRGDAWRVVVDAGTDPITGKRRQLTRTVHGTKREAEAVRNAMLTEIAEGRVSRTRSTVADLLDAWFEANEHDWSPRTALENRRQIDTVLIPALGSTKLARLKASDLDAFYARARAGAYASGKPLAASTVRKFHQILRSALQQGVRWEWIAMNPAANAKPPKGKRTEPTPPTPEELASLLELAEREVPDFYVYLRLASIIGARRGEMCGLRWSDFRDGDTVLEVRSAAVITRDGIVVKETKTDRVRRVAIDEDTASLIAEHRLAMEERARICELSLSPDAFVFSYDADCSEPWRPDSVSRRFGWVRGRAGLDNVRLHDLRHFVATQLIAKGVDMRTVATRLGHASPTTTLNTYSHFVPEADREAAELLGGLLSPRQQQT